MIEVVVFGSGASASSHISSIISCPFFKLISVIGSSKGSVFSAHPFSTSLITDEVILRDYLLSSSSQALAVICNKPGSHVLTYLKYSDFFDYYIIDKPLFVSPQDRNLFCDRYSSLGRNNVFVFFQRRTSFLSLGLRTLFSDYTLEHIISSNIFVSAFRSSIYFESKPWLVDPAISGGGVLLNNAIHELDLLLYLLDIAEFRSPFMNISTMTKNLPVEDFACLGFSSSRDSFHTISATYNGSPLVRNSYQFLFPDTLVQASSSCINIFFFFCILHCSSRA